MNLYQKVGKQVVNILGDVQKELTDTKNSIMPSIKGYAPYNLKETVGFYVGGDNASDVLDEGRGRTIEKPFATLKACIDYITSTIVQGCDESIIIKLVSDITTPGFNIISNNIYNLMITSNDYTNYSTLTITSNSVGVYGRSCVYFSGMNITMRDGSFMQTGGGNGASLITFGNVNFDGDPYSLHVYQNSEIQFTHKINFSGTAYSAGLIRSHRGGLASFLNTVTLSGDVVGKRYICLYGGRIVTQGKGPNFIPGTIEGECDEYSLYC